MEAISSADFAHNLPEEDKPVEPSKLYDEILNNVGENPTKTIAEKEPKVSSF
jgi:hypothetical protein